MAKNYRPFILWVPKTDGSEEKERMSVGVPIEKEHFWALWKCFSSHMLREVGKDQPCTNLHAHLDQLGTEFEAIPWTIEHAQLREQLNAIVYNCGLLVSDGPDITGYEDKVIPCTGYVYDPELGRKIRMGIGVAPDAPVWTLCKAFFGQMLCEVGSVEPVANLHTPVSQLSTTTFDVIPWTEKHASMRAELDNIPDLPVE
jgi:hypothetical protein